jgi:uncharacterized repeat protein (TIGR02543 family)
MVCAVFFACENPWMKEILEEKTITFNSNGGSSVPSQTLYRGEKVERPSNPSKGSAIFVGWYEDNGVFIKAWNFDTIPTKDLTLYAKWNEDCTVTFINNGKVYATEIVKYGSMVTPPDKPHIPEGLYYSTNPTDDDFFDWTYDYTGSFDFENTPITSDIMLIARWGTAVYILDKPGNNIFEKAIDWINNKDFDATALYLYTLLLDSDVIISDSSVKYLENSAVDLTVKGLNAVTITLNNNFSVIDTKLTIGNNIKIACEGGSYLFIDSDASLTVSGNASIDNLTLNINGDNASEIINSSVTINDDWVGDAGKLNLRGDDDNASLRWDSPGVKVLKGNVTQLTKDKFILQYWITATDLGDTTYVIAAYYYIGYLSNNVGELYGDPK